MQQEYNILSFKKELKQEVKTSLKRIRINEDSTHYFNDDLAFPVSIDISSDEYKIAVVLNKKALAYLIEAGYTVWLLNLISKTVTVCEGNSKKEYNVPEVFKLLK